MAALIDYSAHFWGEKHIGYNVLYENMKKGEDAVQELINFLKERISLEDDILKCLGKSLNRTNNCISNNGSFVDVWRLTKGTLELWTEIQTTALNNLTELSRDVTRYQEELTKLRKRAKDMDTMETINLMQTTTTCLQKAKETYNQRCAEVLNLKNSNKEWNAASTKEYLKLRNKMNKAHDEYRLYMEKYAQIRDIFEEKIIRAARSFQEHDRTHLIQMKRFFIQMAKYLEDSHNAHAQVSTEYRQSMEHIDIEEIMMRFIEEKGTGSQLPQKLTWNETDEMPADLDIASGIQSQSSSNSSAIIALTVPANQPTVTDLLSLDDATWISAGNNSFLGSASSQFNNMDNCSRTGAGPFGDSSDTERRSEVGQTPPAMPGQSLSNVQQQITSWIGRQKLGNWRMKKHSASQSSLPAAAAAEAPEQANNSHAEFSKSYGEVKVGSNSFLKRYQKRGNKSSTGDLTQTKLQTVSSQPCFEELPSSKIDDPLRQFGPPPPLPNSEPLPLLDFELNPPLTFSKRPDNSTAAVCIAGTGSGQRRWSTDSSTSDDEETSAEFQTSKIRQLQIRPLNESQPSKLNVSLDELRSAIGQIALQKSNTFENDPWSGICSSGDADPTFTQSHGPIRPALTGDEHLRRKLIANDLDSLLCSSAAGFSDFSQSSSVFSTASNIARARPRSHTPLTLGTGSSKQSQPNVAAATPLDWDQQNSSSVKARIPSNNRPPPSTSSAIPPIGPEIQQQQQQQPFVVPVAMAINEHLHAWIRSGSASNKPEIRLFGTVLLSLSTSTLPTLQSMADNSALEFDIRGTTQIKSIIPNQAFGLSNGILGAGGSDCRHFSIERQKLCKFLQEQRQLSPQAMFHNADLLRFEFAEKPNLPLPLALKSRWRRLDESQMEICVDYALGMDMANNNCPLQNVVFTTKVAEPGAQIFVVHSEPQAKLDNTGNIVWEFRELSKNVNPAGTLKAVIRHNNGPAAGIVPTNTFAQFQLSDTSLSGTEIHLDSGANYTLSVFRRKVLTGKYFCDPELT